MIVCNNFRVTDISLAQSYWIIREMNTFKVIDLLVVLIFGIFAIYLVKLFKRFWRLYSLNIPELKLHPFVIEFFYANYLLAKSSYQERFTILTEFSWRYPRCVKFFFGTTLSILVNSPETIQKVLLSPKCVEKWNLFYKLIDRDNGLIAGSARKNWKDHRKFFNVVFGLNSFDKYRLDFEKNARQFCDSLENEALHGNEFDFFKKFKPFAFNILSETTMGMNCKDFPNLDEIIEAFDITEEAFGAKSRYLVIYPQTLYKLTSISRKEKQAQKVLKQMVVHAIEKRRGVIHMNSNTYEQNIAIDLILANEDKFTAIEIEDHIQTLVAAFETTALCLSYTMLLLAIHSDVQEKLYDELMAVCGEDYDAMDQLMVNKCEYLEMVFKESCRMLPPAAIISRETLEDFEIEKGIIIPEGVCLIVNFYALHRNKKFWGEDADSFKPERFSNENSENTHAGLYLPFSAGPRVCIGSKYAVLAIKILIARLVKKYKFETSLTLGDLKLKSIITLKLCGPHSISIEHR